MAVVAKVGNTVIIGLEEGNLAKLRAGHPFHKLGKETGLPIDIVIFYGATTDDLQASVEEFIGPKTKIIDHRNKRNN